MSSDTCDQSDQQDLLEANLNLNANKSMNQSFLSSNMGLKKSLQPISKSILLMGDKPKLEAALNFGKRKNGSKTLSALIGENNSQKSITTAPSQSTKVTAQTLVFIVA